MVHRLFVIVCRLLRLWSVGSRERGSVVVAYGLSHPVACWIPGPGIESESLALKGRFLTTGPPGKSPSYLFKT